MLSSQELKQLCQQPESAILDFKRQFYNFENGGDDRASAAFIKDVCSMTNTVRDSPAYIIFGVQVTPGQINDFIGITVDIDEAILQDKIKSKVHPRPEFKYYTVNVENVCLGVLEFPVRRYSSPISAVEKMKGIEPGKFYYRQGSTNTEALGHDVIRIHEWLQSLPSFHDFEKEKNADLQGLLVQIANVQIPLSQTIAATYTFAKKYKNRLLIEFCSRELQGLSSSNKGGIEGTLDYRIEKVFVTYAKVEINPGAFSPAQLKEAFRREEQFTEAKVLLSQSITHLEGIIDGFKGRTKNSLATITISSREFLPETTVKDYPLTVYLFQDDLSHLYLSIRQKALDLLMEADVLPL